MGPKYLNGKNRPGCCACLPNPYEFTWSQLFHFSRSSQAPPRCGMDSEHSTCVPMSGVALAAQRLRSPGFLTRYWFRPQRFPSLPCNQVPKDSTLRGRIRFVKATSRCSPSNSRTRLGLYMPSRPPTVHLLKCAHGESFMVLKPGRGSRSVFVPFLKFGACERCMADGGDPSAAWEALKVADFEVGRDKDLADRPDKVKWYSPLEGDIWRPRAPGP